MASDFARQNNLDEQLLGKSFEEMERVRKDRATKNRLTQLQQQARQVQMQTQMAEQLGKAENAKKVMAAAKGNIFSILGLAFQAREAAAEHRNDVFLMAMVVALIKDLIDIVSLDILSFLSWPVTIFIFVFLWGRGTWIVRLALFLASAFELFPFVSLLPVSSICVLYAWSESAKQAKEDEADADELEKNAAIADTMTNRSNLKK